LGKPRRLPSGGAASPTLSTPSHPSQGSTPAISSTLPRSTDTLDVAGILVRVESHACQSRNDGVAGSSPGSRHETSTTVKAYTAASVVVSASKKKLGPLG
jgi:hypothetical protein